MSNPARRLVEMLKSWDVPQGTNAISVRMEAAGNPPLEEFWREQADALDLLRDVDRTLDGLAARGQNVGPYRRATVYWYQALFSYENGWIVAQTQGGARVAIDQVRLEQLEMVATYFDTVDLDDEIEEDWLVEIRNKLKEAGELIQAEEALSVATRTYLMSLVAEANRALTNSLTFGGSPLRRVVHELTGAMHSVADNNGLPEPQANRWRTAARALVGGFVLPVAAGAAIAGITHQIDSGSPSPQTTVIERIDNATINVQQQQPPGD